MSTKSAFFWWDFAGDCCLKCRLHYEKNLWCRKSTVETLVKVWRTLKSGWVFSRLWKSEAETATTHLMWNFTWDFKKVSFCSRDHSVAKSHSCRLSRTNSKTLNSFAQQKDVNTGPSLKTAEFPFNSSAGHKSSDFRPNRCCDITGGDRSDFTHSSVIKVSDDLLTSWKSWILFCTLAES